MRGASHKRTNLAPSGIRGVLFGAGLGVLAAKKGPPLVQKVGTLVRNAMLKYVTSHATGATDQVPEAVTGQVPSTDQAPAGSPTT